MILYYNCIPMHEIHIFIVLVGCKSSVQRILITGLVILVDLMTIIVTT